MKACIRDTRSRRANEVQLNGEGRFAVKYSALHLNNSRGGELANKVINMTAFRNVRTARPRISHEFRGPPTFWKARPYSYTKRWVFKISQHGQKSVGRSKILYAR